VFFFNVAFIGKGLNADHDTRRLIMEIVTPIILYLVSTCLCVRDGSTNLRKLLIILLFFESVLSITSLLTTDSMQTISDTTELGESVTRDYERFGTERPGSIIVFGAGTFEHSNILGAFLILVLPQLLISVFKSSRRNNYLVQFYLQA
jgi:hypothetical protein